MIRLCCNKIFFFLLFFPLMLLAQNRYAFVYSDNIDNTFINFYDKVVIDADNINSIYAKRFPEKMVAYVSIGEIEPWRKSSKGYQKEWVISENKTWESLIADFKNEAYQAFLFKRFEALHQMGYQHFFLDTVDAYHVNKDEEFKAQQKALVAFLKELHRRYPQADIVLNRGFELLEAVHESVSAIVAESLYSRYDHNTKLYKDVPRADREWLLNWFKKAKEEYKLDVISIDYANQKERLTIAKKIAKEGVIPYVSDGLLTEQGECERIRIRRHILVVFYDDDLKHNNTVYSAPHLLLSMPIEHLGYIPKLHNLAFNPLPKQILDRYAGVIVWKQEPIPQSKKLFSWMKKNIREKMKFLLLGSFEFAHNRSIMEFFGISSEANLNSFLDETQIIKGAPYVGYEMEPSLEFENRVLKIDNARKKILSVRYVNGQESTPIAIMPWGGFALGESFVVSRGDDVYWTIDPFAFIKEALYLEECVAPDPTTEGGRRILLVHCDGDGFMEMVRFDKKKLAGEVLYRDILKKYAIPQSISIIQGEVDANKGLYPKLSKRMQATAKQMYALPWIEPASHTLSHPFIWYEVIKKKNRAPKQGEKYHLPIKDYYFLLDEEIKGSIDFELSFAPANKQAKRVLFWSGDCQPPARVLEYIERNDILAMNGGDTMIMDGKPWLMNIAAFGIERQGFWQIYTGEQNENVFTNNWSGPFWGYRRAIETFKKTESPRRLKPINIYYHIYSASRLASINALRDVYEWAMAQKTSKLYASEYIKRVQDFYAMAIEKESENSYVIYNKGELKTVRFDKELYVDMEHSIGVAGFNHINGATYVILDSNHFHKVQLTNKKPTQPYLKDTNGWVESVGDDGFRLASNVGIEANFYVPITCNVEIKDVDYRQNKENLHIASKRNKKVSVGFRCQR